MKKMLTIALLVAAAGLIACGGNKPAVDQEAPAAAPAATANASPQLVALLPAKNEVPGWASGKAPRGFTADTLYELIDGAADSFVAYGVQQMVTADYAQAGTAYQAVIEIYEMKDPLNAFGKYADERNPDYEFLKVGNEGYSGGTSVNFWKGQYYVKITAFEEKDAIKQEIAKLAQAVASRVTTPGADPVELSCFPKENQLPHTTLFIPKDVLAQSYFTNGFEARYKAGAKEAKLVLIALDNPAAAHEALTRYRESVTKGGKDIKAVTAPGDGGFVGKDGFYGNLTAVKSGKHIVVSLGFASEDAGRTLVGEVVRNLK
jgi:hypothetical protein